MLGFTYNGRHCSKFGICMISKNRSLLPQPKIYTEEALDRDGIYDFSRANPLKRTLYKSREISVECSYVSDSYLSARENAHIIAKWLFDGDKRLIFDDEPTYCYIATLKEKVDLAQSGKRGCFTLIFECEPFAYKVDQTAYTFACTETTNTFYVSNGYLDVQPVFRLVGYFKNPLIETENGIMKYNGTGNGTLELNCEKMTATLDGANVLPLMSGEFFELGSGMNTLFVDADEFNATLYVYYTEKYL